MSMFLASFADDPEEQRFGKAVVHLRRLVFSRLSDDHVIALALLHELGALYRQAFDTDQVVHHASSGRDTQEEALERHLHTLALPAKLAELEPREVVELVGRWEHLYPELPKPFDETVGAFVLHAKTQLGSAHERAAASYQAQ